MASALGARRSALGARRSALGARRSALTCHRTDSVQPLRTNRFHRRTSQLAPTLRALRCKRTGHARACQECVIPRHYTKGNFIVLTKLSVIRTAAARRVSPPAGVPAGPAARSDWDEAVQAAALRIDCTEENPPIGRHLCGTTMSEQAQVTAPGGSTAVGGTCPQHGELGGDPAHWRPVNPARVRSRLGGGLGDRPVCGWGPLFENPCANRNLTLKGVARPTSADCRFFDDSHGLRSFFIILIQKTFFVS